MVSVLTATADRTRPRAPWVAAAGVVAATGADVAFDPAHRHLPLCPFHAAFGWWCPLCGGLRCVDALVRGEFGSALHANLLLVAALPVALGYWLTWLHRSRTGRGAPSPGRRTVALAVLVLAVFTVVRNLSVMASLRPS